MFTKFAAFCKAEPVRAMAILNALIALAVAFGVGLTNEQIAAITSFAGAVLWVGGEIVRAQVAPNAVVQAALTLPANSTMADAKAKAASDARADAAPDPPDVGAIDPKRFV